MEILTQYLLELLLAVITAVVIPVAIAAFNKLLVDANIKVSAQATEALHNAAHYAVKAAIYRDSQGQLAGEATKSLEQAVVEYLKANVPESIARLKLSEEALRNIAVSRLVQYNEIRENGSMVL